MKRILQSALIKLYAAVQATGFISTRPGRFLFDQVYGLYKHFLEAGAVNQLRPLAKPGSTVVDVGANIGFFTRRFNKWVGAKGQVLAIEPEAENFQRLKRACEGRGLVSKVELIQAALGEKSGTAKLRVNSGHPGDHRLSRTVESDTVDVALLSLDDLLEARGWPPVSLIKIDVQGAEEQVLLGAEQTLSRTRPAWFVEVDDAHLSEMGSSAEALFKHFLRHRYTLHRLTRRGVSAPMDPGMILADIQSDTYEDILFLPQTATGG